MEELTGTNKLQGPFCFYLTSEDTGFSQIDFKDMETHAMKLYQNTSNDSIPTGNVV
jgi:hypothetical protein